MDLYLMGSTDLP